MTIPKLSYLTLCRFNAHITPGGPDECWEWRGATADGYGRFKAPDGKLYGAHRIAYTLAKGKIPAGKLIRHSCHNRPCCNPAHLSPGTHQQNMHDKVVKTRALQLATRQAQEATP